MIDWIFGALLIGFFLYYLYRRDDFEQDILDRGGFGMSRNDAVVIVALQDIDRSQQIYYVGRIFNPESVLSNAKDFTDFIFNSEVYENRERALSRAKELDNMERSEYGVSIYDALSSYTFGDAVTKFNKRQYVS